MNNLPYTKVYEAESFGKFTFGVQILVHCSEPIDLKTENIQLTFNKVGGLIMSELQAEAIANDPASMEQAKMERESLIGCFEGAKIFVEEIPNGYMPGPRCRHLPWFVVTTEIGRFKIGWRKRVIHLEWTETTVKATAEDLFPTEDVTKTERIIHAYGYVKAAEYIQRIVSVGKGEE